MEDKKLIEEAKKYRGRAYVPYSNFKVGAALLADNGKVYGGCNVENSSYGLTICAERAAIAGAVAEGMKKIEKIAIVTSGKEFSRPCGACRQVIIEFGRDAEVLCCDTEDNCDRCTAAELLPHYDISNVFRDNLKKLQKENLN
ncbi:MAG: cytidine deaminase [Elusimicrobiota bacterium]|nr:cytidine deaminase [Elusimicrobiota bacterium]